MARLEVFTQAELTDQLFLPRGKEASELYFLTSSDRSNELSLMVQRPAEYLAAFMMTNSGWVLMSPPGHNAVSVNHVPVIGLKILNHGDRIEMAEVSLRFIAEVTETLEADSALIAEGKGCPWCQENFEAGDTVIHCPRCGLAHHAECWADGKKCGGHPFCGYYIYEEEDQPADETE